MLSEADLIRLRDATDRHMSLDWKIANILLDEIDRLRAELSEANRRIESWKAEEADWNRDMDRLRAALDARPDISAEDAALVRDVSGLVGVSRVYRALMVHAAKAVKP